MPFAHRFRDYDDCECGLVFALSRLDLRRPIPVPLKKVDVKARVVGFVAEVDVHQEYINQESDPIEAVYMFPVEESAAVVEFRAEVDGKKIETIVKEKKAAAEQYKEAVAEQKTAFLVSQTKPDIFEIKVGHLKPGAGAKIMLKYVTELPVEIGSKASRLTIPTTIAPRYVPPTDNSEEAKAIGQIGYSLDSPAPMTIEVEAVMQSKITSAFSPSHPMTSEIGEKEGQFRSKSCLAARTSDMDRDFIYLIETEEPNKPTLFVEKDDESVAAMVSLVPTFELDDQKVEIIFLVDRSGSMSGMGIKQARDVLHLFIHSLPANCYFNICSFGSGHEFLFGESQRYTDETLAQAQDAVSQMSADFEGTDIFEPLQTILKSPRPSEEHLRQIFLLTDGQVSNVESILSLVKKHSDKGRTFAMGLGSGASRHLVKGVARSGGGTAVFAGQGEDLGPKVLGQLRNALQPSMNNVRLEWMGVQDKTGDRLSTVVSVETKKTLLGYKKVKTDKLIIEQFGQAPVKIAPIFDGTRLLVYRLFAQGEKPTGVQIIAQSPDGPLTADIKLDKSSVIQGDFVHRLAARKKIQELEEEDGLDPRKVREAIVGLGCRYSLASKYTSFVGVDDSDNKKQCAPMQRRGIRQQDHIQATEFDFSGDMGTIMECSGTPYSNGSDDSDEDKVYIKTHDEGDCDYEVGSASCQELLTGNSRVRLLTGIFHWDPILATALGDRTKKRNGCSDDSDEGEDNEYIKKDADEDEKDGEDFMEVSVRAREAKTDKTAKGVQAPEAAASCGSKPEYENMSTLDQMKALVSLQGSTGIFRWDPILATALGTTKEEIERACPAGVSMGIWITAITVILLRERMGKFKDWWHLIVNKAMKQVETVDADKVLAQAKSVIG